MNIGSTESASEMSVHSKPNLPSILFHITLSVICGAYILRKTLNECVWNPFSTFLWGFLCFNGVVQKRGLGKFFLSTSPFIFDPVRWDIIFGAAGRDRWRISRAIYFMLLICVYNNILEHWPWRMGHTSLVTQSNLIPCYYRFLSLFL